MYRENNNKHNIFNDNILTNIKEKVFNELYKKIFVQIKYLF